MTELKQELQPLVPMYNVEDRPSSCQVCNGTKLLLDEPCPLCEDEDDDGDWEPAGAPPEEDSDEEAVAETYQMNGADSEDGCSEGLAEAYEFDAAILEDDRMVEMLRVPGLPPKELYEAALQVYAESADRLVGGDRLHCVPPTEAPVDEDGGRELSGHMTPGEATPTEKEHMITFSEYMNLDISPDRKGLHKASGAPSNGTPGNMTPENGTPHNRTSGKERVVEGHSAEEIAARIALFSRNTNINRRRSVAAMLTAHERSGRISGPKTRHSIATAMHDNMEKFRKSVARLSLDGKRLTPEMRNGMEGKRRRSLAAVADMVEQSGVEDKDVRAKMAILHTVLVKADKDYQNIRRRTEDPPAEAAAPVPTPSGLHVPKPAVAVPVATKAAKEEATACRFFLRGCCNKGKSCAFYHADDDERAPAVRREDDMQKALMERIAEATVAARDRRYAPHTGAAPLKPTISAQVDPLRGQGPVWTPGQPFEPQAKVAVPAKVAAEVDPLRGQGPVWTPGQPFEPQAKVALQAPPQEMPQREPWQGTSQQEGGSWWGSGVGQAASGGYGDGWQGQAAGGGYGDGWQGQGCGAHGSCAGYGGGQQNQGTCCGCRGGWQAQGCGSVAGGCGGGAAQGSDWGYQGCDMYGQGCGTGCDGTGCGGYMGKVDCHGSYGSYGGFNV